MNFGSLTRHISRLAPETLFAVLAALGGLMLLALIPPMGGGNEQMNFRRAASIASGHIQVAPVRLPGGIADFLEISDSIFREGRNPPYSYSRAEFEKVASIPLQAERPRTVPPNPIAVLHPASYLPQVPIVALGQLFGLSPLTLFYLGRLAGLAAGIALTFFAIRIIPIHKHGLAAIALLPTILFSRSTLDADQFTNGLAFVFLALTMREIAAEGRIKASALTSLAVGAFFLAQSKSAYLFMPLLAVAIPTKRFPSARSKAAALSIIVLPGLIGSLTWMVMLKRSYFHGLQYTTWSGIVLPDQQLSFILSQPLAYAEILARTVFATPFLPKALIDFLGLFGPPVMMPALFYPLLTILLAGVILSEDSPSHDRLISRPVRSLAAVLALITIGTIVTLLYLQWTRFQDPTVEGFNGRYLYPLAPLLLIFLPSGRKALLGLRAAFWLLLLGSFSVAGTCWVTWVTYWA